MADTPTDDDTLLIRTAAAEALAAAGYPVAARTLATIACRGGGPPFRHFGARALYRWADALAWAEARLSPPMCSTSEADLRARTRPGARRPDPRTQACPGPRQSEQHRTA